MIRKLKLYIGWTLFCYDKRFDLMVPLQTFWTYGAAKRSRFSRTVENLGTMYETDRYYIAPYQWGVTYNDYQNITTQEK